MRLDLPGLDSFTEDEQLLARMTVGVVRNGGALFTGRYLECVVARLLGASFPRFGTSPWDLILDDDTKIEVKSGDSQFTLGDAKEVDVWVFVHKGGDALRFSVATSEQVGKLGRRTVSAQRVAERYGVVGPDELASRVDAVRKH